MILTIEGLRLATFIDKDREQTHLSLPLTHDLGRALLELHDAFKAWRYDARCAGCGPVRENEHHVDCPVNHAFGRLVMAQEAIVKLPDASTFVDRTPKKWSPPWP